MTLLITAQVKSVKYLIIYLFGDLWVFLMKNKIVNILFHQWSVTIYHMILPWQMIDQDLMACYWFVTLKHLFFRYPLFITCPSGYHEDDCRDRCAHPSFGYKCQGKCKCNPHLCHHINGCPPLSNYHNIFSFTEQVLLTLPLSTDSTLLCV